MQYLYECMYGKPMPDEEPSKPGADPGSMSSAGIAGNVVPFPKRFSLGLRRKILRDAMQQLETGEGGND